VGSLSRSKSKVTELASGGRTVIHVAIDNRVAGLIAVADASRDAVQQLRALGVEVVMLTGDNRATAERIAHNLGIDTIFAEMLPG